MTHITIKRALISVSDKTNIETLAQFLLSHNVQIISTGGTAKQLQAKGLNVTELSDYTGAPEILDGRVKTLHPKVHGGLLGRVDNAQHRKAMEENNISPIELVIVNLYPFEATVARGAEAEEVIENIDIGGPSMIRSAAKNHHFATVITDPNDYDTLMSEMKGNNGAVSFAFRQKMAAKAFTSTAKYDTAISQWFASQAGETFPPVFSVQGTLKETLRYGENPHQQGAYYTTGTPYGIAAAKQLQGKELSYNNIHDADAALQLVMEFKSPTAVIVKHTNPCGIASSDSIEQAYVKALSGDPVSAFGGILAFNRPITITLATEISQLFAEAIIAPSIDPEAANILSKKKNLRVLIGATVPKEPAIAFKSILGGFLVQETDFRTLTSEDLKVVTKKQPAAKELEDLLFAFTVCKHVKSNAIVIAKELSTLGIGAGQMSRVDAVNIAIQKAQAIAQSSNAAQQAVLASDAFFPFPDSVHLAAKAGISAIIQPAGSIRDAEVIAAADELNIAIVHTPIRHFKH